MNKSKPILIIFEVADKTGKTTIRDRFNKKTNFGYVVLDRLTTSSKIYNEFFGRDRLGYYKTIEDAMIKAFNVLVVLCECDTEIILERLRNANEELPDQLKNIDEVKKAFREEVERSFINYVVIDTTNKEIDECVDSIITRVMEMEKIYGKEYNCV